METNADPSRDLLDMGAIADAATGPAVLGTGDGGDPTIGRLVAGEAVAGHRPVRLVAAGALADDDLVTTVRMAVAPTVLVERIPNGGELDVVVARAIADAGQPPTAIIPVEIGGVNALFSVAADGMGRAFPAFQMTAVKAGGVRFGQRFVADEKGNVLRIDAIDAAWIQRINRRALVAMGGSVIAALALRCADVKRTGIHDTIALAWAIGAALAAAPGGGAPLAGAAHRCRLRRRDPRLDARPHRGARQRDGRADLAHRAGSRSPVRAPSAGTPRTGRSRRASRRGRRTTIMGGEE